MKELAKNLDFQLYLEGVPVPFETANLTCRIGSPATAEISIPPTQKSQAILPRTSVHLFYIDPDDVYSSQAGKEFSGKASRKLMFEGEVLGVSYNKTTASRSTNLLCVDHTNNFDYAHRYMLEDVPELMGSQCNKYVSGTKPEISKSNQENTQLTSPIAAIAAGSDTLAEGVKALIESVFIGNEPKISTNEFLESVEQRFKLSERVTYVPDEEIKKLVNLKNLQELISSRVGNTPPSVKLSQIIALLLDFVYYNSASVLFPSYNNKIQNYILSPNIFFSPPPRCNVLFPDHIGNMGFSDMFMSQPTRMLVQAPPFGEPAGQTGAFQCARTYVAPREIGYLLAGTGSDVGSNQNNSHRVLTAEEKLKGIVPVFKQFGRPEFETKLGADKSDESTGNTRGSARNYMINMAEYELDVYRAETRNIPRLNGPFNPNAIIGAPAVVLDEVLYVFGMMDSITHMISATGAAQTSYGISKPRRVPVDFESLDLANPVIYTAVNNITGLIKSDSLSPDDVREKNNMSALKPYIDLLISADADDRLIELVSKIIFSPVDERDDLYRKYELLTEYGVYENMPEAPRWINKAYNSANAGDTYQQLYGCKSVMEPVSGNTTYDSISLMIRELMSVYNSSEDKLQFVDNYCYRNNVTTQIDFNDYYQLEHFNSKSKAYPPSGPFTSKRQKYVLAYANDLKKNVAHKG